jgi:hypothetical protein
MTVTTSTSNTAAAAAATADVTTSASAKLEHNESLQTVVLDAPPTTTTSGVANNETAASDSIADDTNDVNEANDATGDAQKDDEKKEKEKETDLLQDLTEKNSRMVTKIDTFVGKVSRTLDKAFASGKPVPKKSYAPTSVTNDGDEEEVETVTESVTDEDGTVVETTVTRRKVVRKPLARTDTVIAHSGSSAAALSSPTSASSATGDKSGSKPKREKDLEEDLNESNKDMVKSVNETAQRFGRWVDGLFSDKKDAKTETTKVEKKEIETQTSEE